MQYPNNKPDHCPDHLLPLLGQTREYVIEKMGEPVAEYPHRGKEILLFDSDGETISCELKNNAIISINTFKDRRRHPRIKPSRAKRAYLRIGQEKYTCTIIDLSESSVSMQLGADAPLPQIGTFVTFCTNLRTRHLTRIYINLAGKIHSADSATRKIVILIHSPFETHSHRALHDYINVQQALLRVGPAVRPAVKPRKDDYVQKDITIIKSDICVVCQEGLCGVAFNPFGEENTPVHKGT